MRISHIGWNLGGLILPLMVAALTVPGLIERLGHERFGLLALAWGLIGYAGALDLGLGRALTQRVAKLRGENNLGPIPATLATASRITLLAGLASGALITLVALLGGAGWIRTESTTEAEIAISLLLLAVALPAQAMSATYKGLNEAFINFKGISMVRAGLGVINFAGPYAVSQFTTQLPWLVSTLVISRLVSLVVYKHLAVSCVQKDKKAPAGATYSAQIARSLFSFGGWVTVSSVISPILVQADRFFIATMISAAAVSVYVLPYEVVVQCLVLASAVSSVMFPELSRLIREQPKAWRVYLKKWVWRMCYIMATICILMILLLPHILLFWIGSNLNSSSVVIGQILCIGVFFNSIGTLYYAALHAEGRADITAKIHLIELPFYIVLLVVLMNEFGILGAAMAWVARMVMDTGLLLMISRQR